MADTNPTVRFGGDASGVKQGAKEGGDAVQGFADSVQGSIDQIKSFAEAIGAMWAVDKMEEFTRSVSDLGEQLERTAHMTGLSIDSIQNFQFAVQATGGDAETAQMSLLRMERNMSLAAAQGGEMADAFTRAGVSAKTLASGNVDQALAEMADKFHDTADGANKTEAAMQIAGRGGASLVPILDQGRAGLTSLAGALDATGAKLSPELTEKFAQTHQQITLFDTATQGAGEAIFAKLEPGIDGAVVGLTRLDEQFTQNVKDGGAFGDIMDAAGKGMAAFVIGIDAIKTALEGLWNLAKTTFEEIGSALALLGDELVDVFSLQFGKAKTDFKNDVQEMKDIFSQSMTEMGEVGDKFGADFMRIMDAVSGKNVGLGTKGGKQGTSPFPAPPPKNDKPKDDFSDQRALLEEDYGVKKEYDDLKVESGEMSHKEELNDLMNYNDVVAGMTGELFDKQMEEYSKDSIEYQKLNDKKVLADQKFNIEHMKLTQAQLKDDMKVWTDIFDTIEKNFDSMIKGLMQGTQTFSQAFRNLAQNLVISFVEAIAKMGAEWIKKELMQTAATIAGNAARTASDTAAASASKASSDAASSSQIMKDAKEAAANVYADVSAIPYVGWILAPPAAAAAFAAVAAFDSFDTGTSYVPHDQLANIHQGEIIVPRAQSDAIRAGEATLGGGGGSSVHFHINAMDSDGVKKSLMKNHAAIAAAVSQAARGGNSTLRTAFAKM